MTTKHTPGPWIVATSNSWRRIETQEGKPVCVPTKSAADGHPDIIGRTVDLELMARAPEMLDEIEQLQKRLAEAEAQIPRWIPVSEGLPELGEYVLLNVPLKGFPDYCTVGSFSEDSDDINGMDGDPSGFEKDDVEGWMPLNLPNPPEGE